MGTAFFDWSLLPVVFFAALDDHKGLNLLDVGPVDARDRCPRGVVKDLCCRSNNVDSLSADADAEVFLDQGIHGVLVEDKVLDESSSELLFAVRSWRNAD